MPTQTPPLRKNKFMALAIFASICLALTLAVNLATFSPVAFAAPAAPAKKPAAKRYTAAQFLETTNMRGASFSADEKRIMYSSNETGIFNAYAISAAGGKAEALTKSSTDSTYSVAFFPEDDRIVYTRDNGGDENNKL